MEVQGSYIARKFIQKVKHGIMTLGRAAPAGRKPRRNYVRMGRYGTQLKAKGSLRREHQVCR